MGRVDLAAQQGSVLARDEAGLRDLHVVRIAQVLGAVGIGQLHGFGHVVDGLGAVLAPVADRPAFHDVEDLQQVDAARGRGRHGDDLILTVAAAHGLALHRLVALQVGGRDQPFVRLAVGHDLFPDGAAVEGIGPLQRDELQRAGQVLLHQAVAGLERCAVPPEDGTGGGPPAHRVGLGLQRAGQRRADRIAFLGQLDGGGHDLGQREPAPFLLGMGQAGHGAGHAHGSMGVERLAVDDVALGVLEGGAGGRGGRGLAEVQRHVLAGAGVMHHHEAAAPDVAGVGQHHRQRKAHRHGGVNGIAPGLQDVDPYLAGQRLFTGHHAMTGHHRMKDILLRVVARGGRLGQLRASDGEVGRGQPVGLRLAERPGNGARGQRQGNEQTQGGTRDGGA